MSIVLFYFVLFDLKRSHKQMPVGVHWSSIKRLATSFVDVDGATYVWPQVPDYLEFIVFCFVLLWRMQGIQAPPYTDNPHLLFCFCRSRITHALFKVV